MQQYIDSLSFTFIYIFNHQVIAHRVLFQNTPHLCCYIYSVWEWLSPTFRLLCKAASHSPFTMFSLSYFTLSLYIDDMHTPCHTCLCHNMFQLAIMKILSFAGELTVNMTDMYDFGDWGSLDTCETGSYVAGIRLVVIIQDWLMLSSLSLVKNCPTGLKSETIMNCSTSVPHSSMVHTSQFNGSHFTVQWFTLYSSNSQKCLNVF